MAYKGLVGKIMAGTALALGLSGTPDLRAQALVNLGAEVVDTSNNQAVSGSLQEGHTYLINLNIENIQTYSGLDFNDIKSAFKATFTNGFDVNEVNFNYVNPTSTSNEGTPLNNDIFSSSTGRTNTYGPVSTLGNTMTFSYERTAVGNLPLLDDFGEKANVVSFYFTPGTGSAGGNVSFTYDTGATSWTLNSPSTTDLFAGGNYQLLGNTNSLNFNITAVPEPSAWSLLAGGLAFAGAAAWRRRNRVKTQTGKTDYVEKDGAIDI
ncbi:MAG TPA: PEP-CTERM sorting domain-containing protein [Candidatus Nanoarchaeia archaeon]|nr:PEP-CTERM sorting domain-containing protein [Candidatus Nanoarchaeia archaeon]